MAAPEHTDPYSCVLGASCPRALLLADLELLARYAARLASDWDSRHLVHVGHLAENAARLASGPMCGGDHA